MTTRHFAPVLAVAVMFALCGCSTPSPVSERVPNKLALASSFVNAAAGNTEPVAEFWRGFADADLDALMAEALKANVDLRIASANLQEARALARFADAQLKPSIGTSANVSRIRAPDTQGKIQTFSQFAAGFDAAWEADLFGRISSDRRAAAADVLAGEAGVRAAQVSVAAELARNYFELRGLQEQIRIAMAALETQQAALKLVQARLSEGRGTALDTERAQSLVQTTMAAIPALESALARSRYRIAVLTGRQPTALDLQLAPAKPLPGLTALALGNIGSPESLLRRRPDIAAAEAQVVAAAARVGVARSSLFPRITLGGSVGLNAGRISELGNASSFVYNFGANLVWSLLDFGRVRAQIAASEARSEGVLARYEKVILTALEETEGALSNYSRTQQKVDSLFTAEKSAAKAAEIARVRFTYGATDFFAVLDAERELLAARDRLAQSQTAAATSLVAVYKAFSGGFTP
ncbi:MAG: TolC family protein [Burkholderiales bacterium]